jgi:dihydroflavonol-4-reductase
MNQIEGQEEKSAKEGGKLQKVLVTGAGGCVGSQVVAQLVEAGIAVRATDRSGTPIPLPEGGGEVEIVEADLAQRESIAGLVQGVDAIIHTAAIVHLGLSLEQLAPVNIDAVRELYRAGTEEGVAVFVFYSTGSLYRFKEGWITEEDPIHALNDYAYSKQLAEEFLQSQGGEGPRANIIRPALIYGPRGKVLLNMLATLGPIIRSFSPVAPHVKGGPRNNAVHSSDAAGAGVFLAQHPQPHGEIFNIANDDPMDVGDLLRLSYEGEGIRPIGPALPYPTRLIQALVPLIQREEVFKGVNLAVDQLWGYLRRRHQIDDALHPRIDQEMLDFVTSDVLFRNAKIKRAGYTLKYPTMAPGWEETLRWFRQEHWLPLTA